MEHAVGALRARGEAFAMTLTTLAGRPIEAQGRAIGGRAVLRLKDAERVKRELVELAARHERLANRSRVAAHADRNAAVAGLDARRGGPAHLRQCRLCARCRSARCRRRRRAQPGAARQRRAREHRAHARAPAAPMRAGCRRSSPERGAASTCSISAPRPAAPASASTPPKPRPCAARSRAWSTRTAARSISSRPASPCSTPTSSLTFYNAAYRALWDLDAGFLDQAPDRFRRARPAARGAQAAGGAGFPAMEGAAARSLSRRSRPKEHTWHLPDGRTLRVVTTPNPDGGVTYLFHDVTERLDLERRFEELIRVQGETLDNLAEGVAVFAQRRPAAAAQSGLRPHVAARRRDALAERPHIETITALCQPLHGDDADLAGAARRRDRDRQPRADRRAARTARRQRGRLRDRAAAGRRHAGDVPGRHRLGQRRARAARAQRGAGRRRQDQDRFRPPRVLRAALAAHQHHRLRPSARRSGDRPAERRSSANISTTSPSRPTRCSRSSTTSSISPPSMPARMQLNLGPVDIRDTMEAAAEGVQDRLVSAGLTLDIRAPRGHRQLHRRRAARAADPVQPAGQCRELFAGRRHRHARGRAARRTPWCSRSPTTGPGIPPDVQDKVFDWFETHSLGSHHRGTGLGLSLVRSFVELHGGTVTIDSAVGRGTTVTCTFPLGSSAARR